MTAAILGCILRPVSAIAADPSVYEHCWRQPRTVFWNRSKNLLARNGGWVISRKSEMSNSGTTRPLSGKSREPFHGWTYLLELRRSPTSGDLLIGVPGADCLKILRPRRRQRRFYTSEASVQLNPRRFFTSAKTHFPPLFEIHESLDDTAQKCQLFCFGFRNP